MFYCNSVYLFSQTNVIVNNKGEYELAVMTPISMNETKTEVKQQQYLGRHILAEFFECDSNVLNNPELVEKYMLEAALECGATIVNKCFHLFAPHGVSGVVIISESHLAIHTWPEFGYAAVDLFTCGEQCDPKISYEFLKRKFNSRGAKYTQLNRGLIDADQVEQKSFLVAESY